MSQGGQSMSEKNSQDGLERLGFLAVSDSHVSELRNMNEDIKGIGAYLTEKGIHEVLAARQSALARQARLQWSLEMTEKVMTRASSSPYAEQDTLPQVISDWFEVILFIQNQTTDFLSDDDVIFAVAEYYDNFCGGDADLLRGKAADRIIKNYRLKKPLSRGSDETPGRESSFEDEEEKIEPEEPLTLPDPDSTFHVNRFVVRQPAKTERAGVSEAGAKDDGAKAKARDASPENALKIKSNRPDEEAMEILALFQRELSHYVGEGASSVSERTGRNLFASITYTLGLAPDKNLPVDQRFFEGQQILLSLLQESEINYRAILEMKLHIPLDTYYGTVYREIPTFFRLYDAQYASHETPSLLDYPLAIEIEDMSGIIYMNEYLRRLRSECEYVRRIPGSVCGELIKAYSRKYDMDVTSIPVNFYEMLMGQAFAVGLILDTEAKDTPQNTISVWKEKEDLLPELWLRPMEDFVPVLSLLDAMSFSERREKLQYVCEKVCEYPQCLCSEAEQYANSYAERWMNLFESALENHCPENLILFPAMVHLAAVDELPDYFALGTPMPDNEYSELVEKLGAAADVNEQNQLIRANVHSKKDLMDILDEDFWMPGEIDAFLATFSPEEQALFAQEGEPDAPHLGVN